MREENIETSKLKHSASGVFTISLDFELMWGVFDKRTVEEYGANIEGTREAILRMLELFAEFDIGVTWATVGLLLCRSREEMLSRMVSSGLDRARPDVVAYIQESVGEDHKSDPYHFGSDITQKIIEISRQELASHSFSHYGVLEHYSSVDGFKSDIETMVQLFFDLKIPLHSHVFARNQMQEEYIQVISDRGFTAYRGLPDSELYSSQRPSDLNSAVRIKRLLDSYVPLTDVCTTVLPNVSGLLNTKASRFLRPYSNAIPQSLQLKRVKSEMALAAKENSFYHLWWHPHNFGLLIDKQIDSLREILMHYKCLQAEYSWGNKNMTELVGLPAA